MDLNVRAWNLGGLLVLAAGCGPAVVPSGGGSSGSSGNGTFDPSGDPSDPSSTVTVATNDDDSPPATCQDDSDCGSGERCIQGVCEPYEPECVDTTCCGNCGNYDTDDDTDTSGYECDEYNPCAADELCLDHVCIGGTPLVDCDAPVLETSMLPIPGGSHATTLAFVAGEPGAHEQLVVTGEGSIGVVAGGDLNTIPAPQTLQSPRRILVADFDGDGREDVALTGEVDGTHGIQTFAIGDGTVTPIDFTAVDGQSPLAGDFDGDGNADILQWDSQVGAQVSPGLGNGAFGPAIAKLGALGYISAVTDVDADGVIDVISDVGDVWRGQPGFEFAFAGELPSSEGVNHYTAQAADLDGDGVQELVMTYGLYSSFIEIAHLDGEILATYLATDADGLIDVAGVAGDPLDVVIHNAAINAPLGDACLMRYAEPYATRLGAVGNFDGDARNEVAYVDQFEYTLHLVRAQ